MPSVIPIPSRLVTDRPTILLVTQRRNLLLRYAEASHRVCWQTTTRAKTIERQRTRERQNIAPRLKAIETELMLVLSKAVVHPDLSFRSVQYPVRYALIGEWLAATKKPSPSHPKRSAIMRKRTEIRHRCAQSLQDLDHRWLSALTKAIFPDQPLPPRRLIHVSRFKP